MIRSVGSYLRDQSPSRPNKVNRGFDDKVEMTETYIDRLTSNVSLIIHCICIWRHDNHNDSLSLDIRLIAILNYLASHFITNIIRAQQINTYGINIYKKTNHSH